MTKPTPLQETFNEVTDLYDQIRPGYSDDGLVIKQFCRKINLLIRRFIDDSLFVWLFICAVKYQELGCPSPPTGRKPGNVP
jgi:hypothetical protein